jgi:hypothetical protein
MKSIAIMAEISKMRHDIMVLQSKLIDAVGVETGVKVGVVVKKAGREYQISRLEGESAEHMSVYGVVRKLDGSFARREVWLGWPTSVEVKP